MCCVPGVRGHGVGGAAEQRAVAGGELLAEVREGGQQLERLLLPVGRVEDDGLVAGGGAGQVELLGEAAARGDPRHSDHRAAHHCTAEVRQLILE